MSRNWFRDDPVADSEDHASNEGNIIGYCESCGKPIYDFEEYYDINGTLLHDETECVFDWLSLFRVKEII